MNKAEKDGWLWLTRTQCAALLKIGERQFDAAVRPSLEGQSMRGVGKALRFFAPDVVEARMNQKGDAGPAGDDPLLVGSGDSPNLERYRGAKAALAEMDLEERTKTHANLQALDTTLLRFASRLRRGGEVLQRRFGNEASDVLNEAIDDAERLWAQECDRLKHDGGTDNSGQQQGELLAGDERGAAKGGAGRARKPPAKDS